MEDGGPINYAGRIHRIFPLSSSRHPLSARKMDASLNRTGSLGFMQSGIASCECILVLNSPDVGSGGC